MAQISILVYVSSVEQALKVVRLCEREYLPVVANSFDEVPSILKSYECWAAIIDSSFADYDRWKNIIAPDCSVSSSAGRKLKSTGPC